MNYEYMMPKAFIVQPLGAERGWAWDEGGLCMYCGRYYYFLQLLQRWIQSRKFQFAAR